MRNDLQFELRRAGDMLLGSIARADFDQRLGTPTVIFPAFGLRCSCALSLIDRGRQAFGSQIIVEADCRQNAQRGIAFQDDYMGARRPQCEAAIVRSRIGVQDRAEISGSRGRDGCKSAHALGRDAPALPRRAMPNEQREGDGFSGPDSKLARLDPEIMPQNRATQSHDDDRQYMAAHHWASPVEDECHLMLVYAFRALLVLLTASPAAAHSGTGLSGGFAAGFAHPFSGADHMLAMVSVGLWGAILGRPSITLLPAVFPTVMAFGGVLAIAGVMIPPVEIGIALSVIVLGGLILAAVKLPTWLACVIVAGFAIFHGYAHGFELPSAADPIGYSAGFVVATGMLHVGGIGIGTVYDRPIGALALRFGGGVIAACGVWFLGQAL